MDENAPHAEQRSIDSVLSTVGITVRPPRGKLEIRNGRMTIGVIRICGGRIKVVPRHGITRAERRKLVHAATRAWMYGPVGPAWMSTARGWMIRISVAQSSIAASAFIAAMSSGPGTSSSYSASGSGDSAV